MAKQEDVFKKLISHAKEYGFIFPSSEIYDGLSAIYDYGQNGAELKNNIKQYWWKAMVQKNENIVGIDSAIFMHPTIWKASGHVYAFNDPLIDNKEQNIQNQINSLFVEIFNGSYYTERDKIIITMPVDCIPDNIIIEEDNTITT